MTPPKGSTLVSENELDDVMAGADNFARLLEALLGGGRVGSPWAGLNSRGEIVRFTGREFVEMIGCPFRTSDLEREGRIALEAGDDIFTKSRWSKLISPKRLAQVKDGVRLVTPKPGKLEDLETFSSAAERAGWFDIAHALLNIPAEVEAMQGTPFEDPEWTPPVLAEPEERDDAF